MLPLNSLIVIVHDGIHWNYCILMQELTLVLIHFLYIRVVTLWNRLLAATVLASCRLANTRILIFRMYMSVRCRLSSGVIYSTDLCDCDFYRASAFYCTLNTHHRIVSCRIDIANLSVRPSVRPSVCPLRSGIRCKRLNISS